MSEKFQLSRSDHAILSKLCKKLGVIYACTAFDINSLIFLDKVLKIPFFKIPSGEVNSIDMINYISRQKKPVLLSTGMSDFEEIKKIKKRLQKFNKIKVTILHCVSSYPAEINIINLNIIDELKKKFKCDVGYSDHSLVEETCIAAVAKGARVIEKHVTTSKLLNGPDHRASFTIAEFKSLVHKIRNTERILGKSKKKFSNVEINIQKMAKKSLVTTKDLKKGHILRRKDICFKRPGTGISPINYQDIIGKVVNKDIKKNRVIKKQFINSSI